MLKQISNYIVSVYNKNIRKEISLTLFITNKCNLRCKHCFYSKYLDNSDELDFKDIIRFVRQTDNKVRTVAITGGEPFLVANIEQLVNSFIDQGVKTIVFNTNGVLYDRIIDFSKNIKDLKCKFIFAISLDGLAETHDNIRGMKGSFDKAIKTATSLRDRGFEVYFNTTINRENIHKLPELSDYIDSNTKILQSFELIRGVSQTGLPSAVKNETDPKEKSLLISPEDTSEVYRTMLKIFKDKYKNKRLSLLSLAAQLAIIDFKLKTIKSRKRLAACNAGVNTLVLYPKGQLSYCELMNPIGNILENDFENIKNLPESKIQRKIIRRCFCTHGCFINYESRLTYPLSVMMKSLEIRF